jgi:hypothetical protein
MKKFKLKKNCAIGEHENEICLDDVKLQVLRIDCLTRNRINDKVDYQVRLSVSTKFNRDIYVRINNTINLTLKNWFRNEKF